MIYLHLGVVKVGLFDWLGQYSKKKSSMKDKISVSIRSE